MARLYQERMTAGAIFSGNLVPLNIVLSLCLACTVYVYCSTLNFDLFISARVSIWSTGTTIDRHNYAVLAFSVLDSGKPFL